MKAQDVDEKYFIEEDATDEAQENAQDIEDYENDDEDVDMGNQEENDFDWKGALNNVKGDIHKWTKWWTYFIIALKFLI